MEREVGKFIIRVTDNEITAENFFKHSVAILEPNFVYIDKSNLDYYSAKTLRYSDNEEEIKQVIKTYISNLKFRISELEKLLE